MEERFKASLSNQISFCTSLVFSLSSSPFQSIATAAFAQTPKIMKGLRPITFRPVDAWRVHNPKLKARFEEAKARIGATGGERRPICEYDAAFMVRVCCVPSRFHCLVVSYRLCSEEHRADRSQRSAAHRPEVLLLDLAHFVLVAVLVCAVNRRGLFW